MSILTHGIRNNALKYCTSWIIKILFDENESLMI